MIPAQRIKSLRSVTRRVRKKNGPEIRAWGSTCEIKG